MTGKDHCSKNGKIPSGPGDLWGSKNATFYAILSSCKPPTDLSWLNVPRIPLVQILEARKIPSAHADWIFIGFIFPVCCH